MFASPLLVSSLISCAVTPNDGKIDGDTATTDATVQNTEPTVTSVSIDNGPFYTNDTLTATAVLADDDAEQTLTANYEWHVVDSSAGDTDLMIQSGASDTLDGTQFFDKDDSVYVIVTPNDGVEDGPSLTSIPVSISNSIPTSPSISISADNDPAEVGIDDLTCSIDVESTDIDGDTLTYTYTWYDQDGLVASTTLASNDLSDVYLGTGTDVGTWTCEVVANDGSVDSDSVDAVYEVEEGCWSLQFDGVNDVVDLGTGLNLQNFTIEAWIKTSSSQGTIIAKHLDASTNSSWLLYTSSFLDAPSIYYTSQTSQVLSAPGDASIADNKYHNLIAQFDGTQLSLYVDGVLVSNTITSSPIKQTSVPVGIGARRNSSNTDWNELFSGTISTIKISDSALYSGSNITVSTETISDSATIALWDFSTGFGSTLYDQSGNGHNGTINGATWVNSCPEEDLDGDGVAAWEDCDDGDASIYPFAGDTYGDGIDSDCDGLDCEAASDGSTYFAWCPEQTTWSGARTICQSAGYDDLAILDSLSEDNFVSALRPTPASAWIGLSDSVSEGSWVWVNGNPANYTGWYSPQPDSFNGNEDCALLGGSGAGWGDQVCSSDTTAAGTVGFVCEKR
jgi:hypothetical protein